MTLPPTSCVPLCAPTSSSPNWLCALSPVALPFWAFITLSVG